MNVGIVCYASVGGSGIVATELAKVLARRGHEVRLISSEPPVRLGDFQAGLAFHAVQTPGYPLFREPQYMLSLASKIVEVARAYRLDIIHAHYAIPHATAAYLARQILAAGGDGQVPCVITTLHGTDVTLIGSDPSYLETAAFSIDHSDGVTAVSEACATTPTGTCRWAPASTSFPTSSTASITGARWTSRCGRVTGAATPMRSWSSTSRTSAP